MLSHASFKHSKWKKKKRKMKETRSKNTDGKKFPSFQPKILKQFLIKKPWRVWLMLAHTVTPGKLGREALMPPFLSLNKIPDS